MYTNYFKKAEGDWIKHCTTLIGGGKSCDVAKVNPKIIFEVDAFLFHVKDCLDVLSQLIRRAYRLPYDRTYKNSRNGLRFKENKKNIGSALLHSFD